MNLPDVVGFRLSDARKKINELNFEIERIVVTSPPRENKDHYSEESRVLRLKLLSDNKIELLVCNPLY